MKLHAETQDFYRAKFDTKTKPNPDLSAKTVTVMRGVGHVIRADSGYTPAPVESWTTDKATPDRFGKMMQGRTYSYKAGKHVGKGYSVLTSEMPVSNAMMTWESTKGYWPAEADLKGKKEWVMFGGGVTSPDVRVVE